ncbi:MAG: peptide chain release factor 1 [Nitrospirae bacterium CG18_big_fil_WC_8_21_14_2_50_70_55]|nr:peptide chain release factor 1 [Deltaproteobacteria bacterium]OIP64841.1 MAG: peptide chain release factor 1 [Nitrospirae bacterium CG2_30_70_394]PIQ06742.1 MAG: peptide chain release factor 1 [Nitrospirae bacterium CG18_big_fil_WC_8_21_14_2_50_70_55]PIU79208.1 MAG: peptide chain release factor 1 [Nitrospirae bacterium CG06_land_8_20_14_3_00_70_43]PIW83549.1 MAG: peptide chain release factor 1 [Nitrospirae bacterium CG_4_8_14_3_um_filter_70_85]PIX84086.1 MAG: peptide chain release factor 1 
MLDKLSQIERRYAELGERLGDPTLLADPATYRDTAREHAHLAKLAEAAARYREIHQAIAEAEELVAESTDPEMVAMAEEELADQRATLATLEAELKLLLLPHDPNDDKNTFLEIRAGTGGDEAALFAAELYRMYVKYAERRGWRVEPVTANVTGIGGYKEVIALVKGDGVYSRLKFEAGTHRVQRVPETESQGRIHTSAVTVAVMPEAEEVDIAIADNELKIDVFRSSGPGGQSVNTTDSAVRITHLPTNTVVICQDEKSQHKNKDKALRVLRARLMEREREAAEAERTAQRRSQVGTGDRSQRIRTYNFPQGRITDHRIGLTLHSMDQFLAGDLDPLLDPLIQHYQAEQLATAGGE